jgi:NAD(P)-dependent dehydrogenase (short-subunit alcohol dehydrogenase family)
MSSKPILLLLGAGANIGAAITKHFSSAGYSIALASRSTVPGATTAGHLGIRADLSDPSSIPSIFSQVLAHFGAAPSCVVYNAANVTPPPDAADPLSLPTEALEKDLRIMTVTPFAAAREAVKGFEALGTGAGKKSFIYTGNILNQTVMPVPALMTLGVGKSAAAYWIGVVGMALEGKGFK